MSLLGSAVQDPKVPPGPPGPVRRHRGGEGTSAAPSSYGYNTEHRHGGIGPLTHRQVHLGRAPEVIAHRRKVLAAAYAARARPLRGWPAEARRTPGRGLDQPRTPHHVGQRRGTCRRRGNGGLTKLNRQVPHNRWRVPRPTDGCDPRIPLRGMSLATFTPYGARYYDREPPRTLHLRRSETTSRRGGGYNGPCRVEVAVFHRSQCSPRVYLLNGDRAQHRNHCVRVGLSSAEARRSTPELVPLARGSCDVTADPSLPGLRQRPAHRRDSSKRRQTHNPPARPPRCRT